MSHRCLGWPVAILLRIIHCVQEIRDQNVFAISPILTKFGIRFLYKFTAKWCKRFPPHLNNVSTLPCETWNAHFVRATYHCYQKKLQNSPLYIHLFIVTLTHTLRTAVLPSHMRNYDQWFTQLVAILLDLLNKASSAAFGSAILAF